MTSNSIKEKYQTTLADWQTSKDYTDKIIETIHEPLLVLDPELCIQLVNPAFYTMFQVEAKESLGRPIYELGNGQWNIPALRVLLEEVLPRDKVFTKFEVRHTFEHLGERTMLLNARRLDHVPFILLAIEDISERKRAEQALLTLNATLETQVAARTAALLALNETLETQVAARTAALQKSEAKIRALAMTLTLAEQAERRRIAQILHEDLQQRLYALQMQTMFVIEGAESCAQSQLATQAHQVYDALVDAIQLTRHLTVDLSPPVLQGEGLVDALHWLVVQMADVHGLQVVLRAAHAFQMPDEDMRVLLFQLVRELLFNVHMHAETDQATVEVRVGEPAHLLIEVSDAGRGFDVATATAPHAPGLGLFSVRERLALFGGHMTIDSAPGQGTRIILEVPILAPPW